MSLIFSSIDQEIDANFFLWEEKCALVASETEGTRSMAGMSRFFASFHRLFSCFCKNNNMLFLERLSGLVEQQIKKNGFLIDRQLRGRGKERDGKKSLRPISPFPDSGGKREESILIPFL